MITREAFLRAIIDRPGEDTPRLVYADWLDENGEPERAEFIRVQVELAKCRDGLESCPPDSRCGRCMGCVLRTRSRELLTAHAGKWFALPGSAVDGWLTWTWPRRSDNRPENVGGTLSRGFVSAVRCSWAAWLAVAPLLTWCEVKCGTCRGYGFCPLCSGEGCSGHSIAVNGPCMNGKCSACGGTGRVPPTVECHNCEGQVYYQPGESGCLVCGSTGRIPVPFPTDTIQPVTGLVLTTMPVMVGIPFDKDFADRIKAEWPCLTEITLPTEGR